MGHFYEDTPPRRNTAKTPPRKQGGIRGHRFGVMCFNHDGFYGNIAFIRFANGTWPVGFRCALPDLRCMEDDSYSPAAFLLAFQFAFDPPNILLHSAKARISRIEAFF